ncbi:GTP 3',8-cyclase [Methylacidimicrobium cyclopophantes]|uniref:GTP 3',8-cyclase n=1 Tax=Methylacidimicrobium cyclopophantes TaxID=1041766 RepID=A0A5E6MHW5_9BACT|nr:GTP 3',8-cyclase MoaA [Methylacidimicrobium cyclopophantes]VVM05086.1 GTP 3',8-cyclase [Methylacidimicrobium cyclopophantes]
MSCHDSFRRSVHYLRISVTDRCNERCLYCFPRDFSGWREKEDLLTYEEILAIVAVAAELGFTDFRITGGEPLVRAGVPGLIREISRTSGVRSVRLSTNGTRLAGLAAELNDSGLSGINISLDALDPKRYYQITGGYLGPVLEGIEAVRRLGFAQIKLNTVLLRHRNEDQIEALLDFAAERDLILRFIELMPVTSREVLRPDNFLSAAELQRKLESEDRLEPLDRSLGFGPARYFRMEKRGVTVGFIGALSDLHFCERCNKMRLTADGRLRPCLGNHLEVDLRPFLRPTMDRHGLREAFLDTLRRKPLEHSFRDYYEPERTMTALGG